MPALKPGDVVIIGNPGRHKGKSVRRAISAAASAKLFCLPPYCLDLNPIEQTFARLKDPASKGHRPNRRGNLETRRRSVRLLHAAGARPNFANAEYAYT
ncbi:transposase [Bradyrhizobium sacchari]|uniref:DDE superfamily endonuclease n=1 Tax=Bradyrhizobium sacchari TaxID=1399419 RepID=A0A560J478_9BRAD|nr:DDE superfamily endonuclease [Bradyrhizobium sacchari]TWB65901.1 DDE superfamily endonuclease [Bradyrhizobium sacchari]